MKIKMTIMFFFLIAGMLIACNSRGDKKVSENVQEDEMHKKHNQLANDFTHQDIAILDQPYQVNETVKGQFGKVIEAYLQLSEALATDDAAKADLAAEQMSGKIQVIPDEVFEGEGLQAWKQHAELYTDKLKEMQHVKGLKNKRSYFSHISEIMYCTVKSFNIKEPLLFAAYCPMAFSGEGAYWLTKSQTINNPYFGEAMLNCGKIKEEL